LLPGSSDTCAAICPKSAPLRSFASVASAFFLAAAFTSGLAAWGAPIRMCWKIRRSLPL
jgi:hypothetical protein